MTTDRYCLIKQNGKAVFALSYFPSHGTSQSTLWVTQSGGTVLSILHCYRNRSLSSLTNLKCRNFETVTVGCVLYLLSEDAADIFTKCTSFARRRLAELALWARTSFQTLISISVERGMKNKDTQLNIISAGFAHASILLP